MAKSTELENGLLGLILVDEKAFHSIKGLLNGEDFLQKENQVLYSAISEIYEKGFEDIELQPIIDHLKKESNFEKMGGIEYLSHLMERPGLKSNVNEYIKAILDAAELKRIKERFATLNNKIDTYKNVDDIIMEIESDIIENARGVKPRKFISSKDAVAAAIKAIEERATGKVVSGIPIGFPSLDSLTGGFQKGDLIIVAARPSMGKTAFALNMAANASLKKNVALFSLEMPIEQLYNRIISFTAFVDQGKLREGKFLTATDWNKIHSSEAKIKNMNLYVDDTAGIKLSELVWKAKQLHKNGKLDMIVIDYLQLIVIANSKGDNRQNEVSIISRTLKKLARDLNVPVIALSQLSRRVEQRENKQPMMSDLRESGAIEQDADIVSFLYREAYYKKQENQESSDDKEITDIIIAKHRNGPTKNIQLFFKPSNGLFIEKGK